MEEKNQTNNVQESKPMSLDAAFGQISAILEQMDAPEVSLEESLQLYKQGVGLLNQCDTKLKEIEKEIIVLTEEGEIIGEE